MTREQSAIAKSIKIPLPDISIWPIIMNEGIVLILLGIGWAFYFTVKGVGVVEYT